MKYRVCLWSTRGILLMVSLPMSSKEEAIKQCDWLFSFSFNCNMLKVHRASVNDERNIVIYSKEKQDANAINLH